MSGHYRNSRARAIRFHSRGAPILGDLHLPAGDPPNGGWPVAIALSGYQGYRDIHPARFARKLTRRKIAVLGFDFRGFGSSGGAPGRYDPFGQVEDTISALNWLESQRDVDPSKVALLGWAMGGSVAIAATAADSRFCGVAAINAVGNYERVLRAMHSSQSWQWLLEAARRDGQVRAATGISQEIPPFDLIQLDEVTQRYVTTRLYKASKHQSRSVTLESVDLMRRFSPEEVVHRIAPRPLLLLHGDENHLHPPSESERLYALAKEPRTLEILPHAGHTEWMVDRNATFERVVRSLTAFLSACFGSTEAAPR